MGQSRVWLLRLRNMPQGGRHCSQTSPTQQGNQSRHRMPPHSCPREHHLALLPLFLQLPSKAFLSTWMWKLDFLSFNPTLLLTRFVFGESYIHLLGKYQFSHMYNGDNKSASHRMLVPLMIKWVNASETFRTVPGI